MPVLEDRGTLSTLAAYPTILKQYVGAGVLGMSFAFAQGGLILSIITTAAIALLASHCISMLLELKEHAETVAKRVAGSAKDGVHLSFYHSIVDAAFRVREWEALLAERAEHRNAGSGGGGGGSGSGSGSNGDHVDDHILDGDEDSSSLADLVDGRTAVGRGHRSSAVFGSAQVSIEEADLTADEASLILPSPLEAPASRMGRLMKVYTMAAIMFTQVGFATAYVIFWGNTLFDHYPHIMSKAEWVLAVSPAFLLFALIRRLKSLAWVGFLGYWFIVGTIGVVAWYSFHHVFPELPAGEVLVRARAFPYQSLPVFLGIMLYTFEGIGLVVETQKSMKEPELFMTVLRRVYVALVITFCLTGSLGYLAFGRAVDSIIILELPPDAWYTLVCEAMLAFGLIVSYPVQLFPVMYMAENYFLDANGRHARHIEAWRNLVRFGVFAVTIVLAALVPHFGLFMSLIGSVGSSSLMFIIPAVCHIRVFPNHRYLYGHYAVVLIGVAGGAMSFVTTVIDIVKVISGEVE